MAEKDKRYYWLKLKRDFFKRHDIQIIEDMDNGKDYILFYLKLLCESVDHEGNLRFSKEIPYNDKMLATITRTNVDIVRTAVKIFIELGMMELLDDGTYYMNKVEEMIGSETYWAEKKRIQRENPKLLDNVQQESNASPTCPSKSKRKSKSKSKSIEKELDKEKELDTEKDKEKDKEKETITKVLNAYAPNGSDLRNALNEFKEMRSKMNKPLTVRALKQALNLLDKLSCNDEMTKVAIVDQSLNRGWQSFYELKVESTAGYKKTSKTLQEGADELASYLDEMNGGV